MKYEVVINQTENGLQANAEQLLALVQSEEFKKYNYIVTANNYDDAKKDKKELDDDVKKAKRERIDFEKMMLSTWAPIKETLMKAEKIVESYSKSLKEGMETLEAKEKSDKKELIEQFFEENKGKLDIPFEKVFEDKFTNKSCKSKEWQEAIIRKVKNYELDYDLLAQMNVEDTVLLQTLFTQTWDRMSAIDNYNAQMDEKKKADEIRAQQEAFKTKLSESVNIKAPIQKPHISEPERKVSVVNEIVMIKGDTDCYIKAKEFALSLGLQWEVM